MIATINAKYMWFRQFLDKNGYSQDTYNICHADKNCIQNSFNMNWPCTILDYDGPAT